MSRSIRTLKGGRLRRAAAIAAILPLALAACSSGGAGDEDDNGDGGGEGTSEAGDPDGDLTIAMVTHEAPGDAFWDRIRAGAEAAAEDLGVTLRYSNNREAPEMATLIDNAVDSNVDALAVTLAYPDAVSGAVTRAIDEGIPTVAFNSGDDVWQDMGLEMYFGSSETVAGEAVGDRLNELGAENVVCLIQESGAVQLEARCDGAQSTFNGDFEVLYAEGTDLPGLEASLTSKLQSDPSIDYVVTLGAPFAVAAMDSLENADTGANLVTFDLNEEVAKAVQDGEIEFTVDQQPYVQGYLSVLMLYLNVTNGNDLGGGEQVLTGPSFVDSENIDDVIEYTSEGTR